MMKTTRSLLLLWLCLLFSYTPFAQTPEVLNILIISENETSDDRQPRFEDKIRDEVNVLLTNRRTVVFKEEQCNCEPAEIKKLFDQAFSDSETDIIIAVGPMTSAVLAQRSSFPKPAIASLIIDNELQNVPLNAEGTSGINNFAYIQSPFSFKKDLELLYRVYPYKNVGIVISPDLNDLFPNFSDLFKKATADLSAAFTEIKVTGDPNTTIQAIPAAVDAVYIFPLFDEFTPAEEKDFLAQLIEKKLPSVALLGESMVAQGVMLGYESQANIDKMPRRIALDISKIVDGKNASELPVVINTFSETAIVNMSTVRKVGTYPDWDMMTEAVLLNANKTDTDRVLSLQTTILEALDQNLSLKVAGINPLLAGKETELAKAEWLPSLDINSSLALLDENTANTSFGTRGRLNWTAGTSLSQLIYSEPALANVAIQKLLRRGEEYGLQTAQLDVVLDAATAFLNVLQAKSFMDIQAGNISVTKNNLDIAKAKDAVGYSGATDLNRWKSELALGKIDLNDAQAQFQQAKYVLNQLLNQPISEEFQVEDIGVQNNLLLVTDDRMFDRIQNEKELEQLADFLVIEAMANLPELKEIDFGLNAQKRLLKSQERAFYLPSFAFSGGADYTLKRWDVEGVGGAPAPDLEPTWNLGLGVQYPIFQGGKRRINKELTQLNIKQVQGQRADARNQLELRVRVALQKASASYFSVLQFAEASKAANDNFTIVQDSYSQGLANVTNLIDAQNAKVQTELGAVNAGYQFILDFLEMERAIGSYYLLSNVAERTALFDRLSAFMVKKAEED